MDLGPRIEERLTALDMSQSELARRASVPQTTINSLIRGGRRSSPHLIKIARALETTPAYLTGETDNPESEWPETEMSGEEAKLLSDIRQLPPKDREAVRHVIDRMLKPRSVHSPKLDYRTPEHEKGN